MYQARIKQTCSVTHGFSTLEELKEYMTTNWPSYEYEWWGNGDSGQVLQFETLKQYYMESHDYGDPWGSNISFWLDLCAVLWARDETIPAEWEYSPGLGSPDCEDEHLTEYSSEALLQLGALLYRIDAYYRHIGLSY